jgi:hypothetical protein
MILKTDGGTRDINSRCCCAHMFCSAIYYILIAIENGGSTLTLRV